ncbi:MAG: hypothetical protein P1U78_14105, partial [Alcanivoracaceae bacterium]|nr:hypothetical protein [Alcanivoracaceae bacterium]
RPRNAYLGTTLDIAQGTLTDDAQALNITSTWNDAADTFTLIQADVTDTASAAGSKLLDLQVGGTSKFSVDNAGRLHVASVLENSLGDGWYFVGGGTTQMRMDASTGLQIPRTYSLAWSDSDNASTGIKDLFIRRDAAGTLAQRNGVNAQTFNIYNTYTNATDYERAHIGWNDTADTFVIGTEAGSGGGVGRNVVITSGGDLILSGDVHASQITGADNNFIGSGAGVANSGSQNVGFGTQSLRLNTGANNTATGWLSLRDNSGDGNTADGTQTLRGNSGDNNSGFGYFSLYLNTGSSNTGFGMQSLFSNTGSSNTASGIQSLFGNTGSNNTASGAEAGRYQSGGTTSLTTASNSVFLGALTKGIQGATNQIVIGDTAESIGANSVVLGNDSIVTTALKGNVGITSTWNDAADTFTLIKADVTDTASAAGSKLMDLQVGGASKFSVDAAGTLVSSGNVNGASPTEMGYLSGVTSGIQAQIDAAGGGSGAFGADANTLITASTPIVLDQATGDEAALTLDYTTNKAAGNDTGLLINQTDTLSPGTSNLLDLQVGGSSKFSVDTYGSLNGTAGYKVALLGGALSVLYRLNLIDRLGFSYGSGPYLQSDANDTLAQRNGVNAQTFNLYNTYTSATNYERAHIGWNDTADTFVIGTEAGSAGGVNRNLRLGVGGGQSIQFYADGSQKLSVDRDSILASKPLHFYPDNTHDIGAGGLRPRNAYLGTTLDIAQGTLTDDAQALNITSTWNDAADTFTLI